MTKRPFFYIMALIAMGGLLWLSHRRTQVVLSQLDAEKKVQSLTADQPPLSGVAAHLSSQTQVWQTELTEILKEKNDNDPRLDKDFRNMPAEMHAWLVEQYKKLPAEDRNGRGKIAFLIARDLKSNDDLNFLRSLFSENPCLSMSNCEKTEELDSHLAGVQQVSLNYPQMVALYQLGNQLTKLANSELSQSVLSVLGQARSFPVPMVQHKAEALLQNLRQ